MRTCSIFVLAVGVLQLSAFADDMSELQILPSNPGSIPAGEDWLMTCIFPVDAVQDVLWRDPNGDVISNTDERIVDSSEPGKLYLTLFNISSEADGKYTCEGFSTTSNGTATMSTQVEVFYPIAIVDTPAVQEFEIGTTVSVVCNVEGQPAPSVIWTIDAENGRKIDRGISDGKYLSEAGTDNLMIVNISKEDERTYWCRGRQMSEGRQANQQIRVNVLVAPVIFNFEPNVTVTEGNSAVLTCEASGDPQPSYSWSNEYGENVGNTSSLRIDDVSRDMDGSKFTCVASNKLTSAAEDVTLTVYVKPSFSLTLSATTNEGGEALIRCTAEGDPNPMVSIYRDGVILEETPTFPDNVFDDDVNDTDASNSTTAGTWVSNRVVTYDGNDAVVNFTYTTYTDAGQYECKAESAAGITSEIITLDVRYPPKETVLKNVYTCPGTSAVLECSFDANPPPTLTWGVGNEDYPNGRMYFNSTDPPAGYLIDDVNGVLLLTIETSVLSDPYTTYYCSAENDIGTNEASAELLKAVAPEPPLDVEVIDIGTREATVTFTPPLVPLVPNDYYVVRLFPANSSLKSIEMNIHSSSNEYRFTELEHNMQYTVVVETKNCVDQSAPSEIAQFTTNAIETPEPVEIVSGKSSEEHDQYTVSWMVNGLGGGEISKIRIVIRKESDKVDVGNGTTTFVDLDEVEIFPEDDDFQKGSYTVEDLDPSSRYEVSVNVHNEVGSAETKHLFITASKPETTTEEDDFEDDDVVAGSVDYAVIIIVIVVLLVLLVVIDVICFATRSWGFTMWVYSHTCGRSKKKTINDVEGGSAELREGEDGKYTSVTEQS